MDALHAMTKDIYWVDPGEDLPGAYEMMKKLAIRHLPVLEGDRLVGIVSHRDVLAHSRLDDGTLMVPRIAISVVMSAPVITCGPADPISKVALKMLDHHIDCVPIVSPEHGLVGLLTSTDFIHLFLEQQAIDATKRRPRSFQVLPLPKDDAPPTTPRPRAKTK